MEYDHGRRVTSHYYEQSPLDRAITTFEEQAKAYYSRANSTPVDASPEQLAKRERELEKALIHLKAERLSALTQVQIQTKLEDYRAAMRPQEGATRADKNVFREAMGMEKHHPTDILAKYMRADGRPQPSPRFTPHHIVQGKGKTELAFRARIALHFHGVRINDPDNGVWMPRHKADKGHWAMPHASAHSEIHTHNYERWVFNVTNNLDSELAFRSKLINIRALLRDGQQPAMVTQPPLEKAAT